jgi:iron complex outermembrane receptor protein
MTARTSTRPQRALLAGAAVAALASALAGSASAQATATIDELVVTAQKRAENVQDVPLSITAVKGEALEALHVTQAQQLTLIDPSVRFKQSLSNSASGFLIRGIGTSSFSAGIEQSISTVVDGVVLADPGSLSTLADVERVEILRGPQGMLFGKNASAGLVHFITKRPVLDDNSGKVRVEVGERGERNFEAIGNVSVGDTAALRLVVVHNERDGIIKNVARGGDDTDPRKVTGVALKFQWKPTENLTVFAQADRSQSDTFCCASTWRKVTPGYAPAVTNAQYGIVAGPKNLAVAANGDFFGSSRAQGLALHMDYDVSGFTLSSISAYREARRVGFYDGDLTPVSYIDLNGGAGDTKWFTQELRLTSPIGERFDYVLGLYYYNSTADSEITQRGQLTWILPASNGQVVRVVPTQPAGTVFQTSTFNTIGSDSYAAFGQGTFHVTDKLDIIGGLRGTHDVVKLNYRRDPVTGTVFIPGSVALRFDQDIKNDNLSWRIGPRYNVTDDIMIYGTVSKGYKGPGFSGLGATVAGSNQRVLPEIPTSYEIGMKSTFFDRRLQVNVSAYDTKVKNFQAQVSDLSSPTYSSRITNAGSIKTKGVEFNVVARPMADLNVTFGGAYTHARYLDFNGVQCYFGQPKVAQGGPCTAPPANPTSIDGFFNAKGLRLAAVPTWVLGSTVSYERQLSENIRGFAQANWNWQSDTNYSANGDPGTIQKAYSLVGGRVGVSGPDDKWTFAIYASNLFDKRWAAQITPSPVTSLNPGGYLQYFSPDSVRRVGASFETRF